ncbi:MAG: tetratricopeptide repeat protein [Asgard group archaeon]|nr:tetratricopeptide repeat protein [Asgard group archaeon]
MKRKNIGKIEELQFLNYKSNVDIYLGNLQESLELADIVLKESKKLDKPLIQLNAIFNKAEVCWRLIYYDLMLECINQGEQILQTLTKKSQDEKYTSQKAYILFLKGINALKKEDFDYALECHNESLNLRKRIGNKLEIGRSLKRISNVYWWKGDYDQSLIYIKQALKLFEEIGNDYDIAETLQLIGSNYRSKGELDYGLEYVQQSVKKFENLGNKKETAESLQIICTIYREKGEFNQALETSEQSLKLFEAIGDKISAAAYSLFQLGSINYQKGELDLSLKYFLKAMKYCEEYDEKSLLSRILYRIILIFIELNDLEQAQKYFDYLTQINQQIDHKLVNRIYRLTSALMLKTSIRLRDWFKAVEILEDLLEEANLHTSMRIEILLNLSAVHLKELQLTGEKDVLDELNDYITRLFELSAKHNLQQLLVEIYRLQGQLALVELDTNKANQLLTKALTLSKEKGLEKLSNDIIKEQQKLNDQIGMWKDLQEKKAPIIDSMKQISLENGVKRISKAILEEKDEETEKIFEYRKLFALKI